MIVLTKSLFFFLLMMFWLSSCSGGQTKNSVVEKQELTVFAAASLTEAFSELAETFESQNPEVEIIFNFAGSSQLAAQLGAGVGADIFAAANETQMQTVIEAGLIKVGTEAWFVANHLAIVVPLDNPAGITSLETLATPGVQLILAVEGVPVRDYTDALVATMPVAFQEQFYANLVSEEGNVRQVLAKVALGEADVGIVYTSDVTGEMAEQVQHIPILDGQNVIAVYPIAPLVGVPKPELTQDFIDFVLSEEGQRIFARWGFSPPPAK